MQNRHPRATSTSSFGSPVGCSRSGTGTHRIDLKGHAKCKSTIADDRRGCSRSGKGSDDRMDLKGHAKASGEIAQALQQARAELDQVNREVAALRSDNADLLGGLQERERGQASCMWLSKENAALRQMIEEQEQQIAALTESMKDLAPSYLFMVNAKGEGPQTPKQPQEAACAAKAVDDANEEAHALALDIRALATSDPNTPQTQLSMLGKAISAGCGERQPLHQVPRRLPSEGTTESTTPSSSPYLESIDATTVVQFVGASTADVDPVKNENNIMVVQPLEEATFSGFSATVVQLQDDQNLAQSEQLEGAIDEIKLKHMEEAYQAAMLRQKEQQQQLDSLPTLSQADNISLPPQQLLPPGSTTGALWYGSQVNSRQLQEQQQPQRQQQQWQQHSQEPLVQQQQEQQQWQQHSQEPPVWQQEQQQRPKNFAEAVSHWLQEDADRECIELPEPTAPPPRPHDVLMAMVAKSTSPKANSSTPHSHWDTVRKAAKLSTDVKPLVNKGSIGGIVEDEGKRKKMVEELAKLKSFFAQRP